jgi:hypothetical protein
MYPQPGPPQRGHLNPLNQRCRLNCSPHCRSSPNRTRNCSTVIIALRLLVDRFFMPTKLTLFILLSKLDIHLPKML